MKISTPGRVEIPGLLMIASRMRFICVDCSTATGITWTILQWPTGTSIAVVGRG